MFKLALVQMLVEAGAKQANLQRAEERIAEAARQGAQVVLLPEALTAGWTDDSSARVADEIPGGESCARLGGAARKHGVLVCAGLVEQAGDIVFNSAVLFGPDGTVLLHHRKINELGIGHGCYAQGDRLGVAQTSVGRIGVMICADAFAPGQVISRTLGMMGADILLSPCAWAVPADHDNLRDPYGKLWLDNYQPVARDFHLWIAGASNVGWIRSGAWSGRKCIGCSLVVDPEGKAAVQGPYGSDAETILLVDVEGRAERSSGVGKY